MNIDKLLKKKKELIVMLDKNNRFKDNQMTLKNTNLIENEIKIINKQIENLNSLK